MNKKKKTKIEKFIGYFFFLKNSNNISLIENLLYN